MGQKQHFTLRVDSDTVQRLVKQASRRGEAKSALAERYLREGVRMAEHPGIVFRDGPAGRRPGLAGSGLDVWEVVETVRNEWGDIAGAAEYLSIPVESVAAAIDYYVDYRDEVDQWIQRHHELVDEAENVRHRRQAAFAP
jgi:uncharacterized protein (DUF433 family)